jgi:hypothetical protein
MGIEEISKEVKDNDVKNQAILSFCTMACTLLLANKSEAVIEKMREFTLALTEKQETEELKQLKSINPAMLKLLGLGFDAEKELSRKYLLQKKMVRNLLDATITLHKELK